MKREFVGIPDLEAAFEAVKNVLFGSPEELLKALGAQGIKSKFNEIRDGKEERKLDVLSRAQLGGARDDRDSDRKDRDHNIRMLTWLLANDPAYAQLHADAVQSWRNTEDAAEDALRQIDATLEEARIDQQRLLERAPLVNGKHVFRDRDGSVWTEDDVGLPDEVAAGIQWKGDEPTRREFKAGQARIDELVRSGERVRGIQVEAADLGVELNDDDNPPSAERTGEIIEELKKHDHAIRANMPKHEPILTEQRLDSGSIASVQLPQLP